MTYNVIVTPTADAEAMEAVAWHAERSTDAAQRWHERLTRAINSLAKLPTRCPVSQEDSKALGCEVRLLLYGKRSGAPPPAEDEFQRVTKTTTYSREPEPSSFLGCMQEESQTPESPVAEIPDAPAATIPQVAPADWPS